MTSDCNLAFLIIIVSVAYGQPNNVTSKDGSRNYWYFRNIRNSPYFVDQTQLLEEFFKYRAVLITCPKNFGKSTNLDMMRRFFEAPFDPTTGQRIDKRTTFYYKFFKNEYTNMKIARCQDFIEEHQGEYPVIYLRFGSVQGTTTEEIMYWTTQKIVKLLQSYRWLYDMEEDVARREAYKQNFRRVFENSPNEDRFVDALEDLVELLQQYFQNRVITLIDDYDAPTMYAITNGADAERVYNFMYILMGKLIEWGRVSTDFMAVGISRLFQNYTAIDVIHNLHHNYFLERNNGLSKYFGFTEDDIIGLLGRKHYKNKRRHLEKHFNNYAFKTYPWEIAQNIPVLALYNPKGVIRYLETNISVFHQPTSKIISKIMKCLRHETFYASIKQLLLRKFITETIPYHMSEDNLMAFTDVVRMNCSIWTDFSYLTPFIDNGYISRTSEIFHKVANVVMEIKLKRDFQNYYSDMLGISITNQYLSSSIQSILTTTVTTNKILSSLAYSITYLLGSRRYTLTEFEFRSIMFAVQLGHVERYPDDPEVSLIALGMEKVLDPLADIFPIPGYEKKILLITKTTYRANLSHSIEEVRKVRPQWSRAASSFEIIKYVVINMNKHNEVEIVKGDDCYKW